MSIENVQKGLNVVNTGLDIAGNADPTIKAGEISGQVAGAVITAISTISDQQKRADFTNAFNSLSASQQQQLNDKVAAATDNLTKLQIISSALVAAKLNSTEVAASNNNRWVIISVSAIFVTIILNGVYKRQKRKL